MDKRRQELWFGLAMLLLCLAVPLAFWMWSEFFVAPPPAKSQLIGNFNDRFSVQLLAIGRQFPSPNNGLTNGPAHYWTANGVPLPDFKPQGGTTGGYKPMLVAHLSATLKDSTAEERPHFRLTANAKTFGSGYSSQFRDGSHELSLHVGFQPQTGWFSKTDVQVWWASQGAVPALTLTPEQTDVSVTSAGVPLTASLAPAVDRVTKQPVTEVRFDPPNGPTAVRWECVVIDSAGTTHWPDSHRTIWMSSEKSENTYTFKQTIFDRIEIRRIEYDRMIEFKDVAISAGSYTHPTVSKVQTP